MKEDRGRSVGGGRTWGSERREGNGRAVGCEEMRTEINEESSGKENDGGGKEKQ